MNKYVYLCKECGHEMRARPPFLGDGDVCCECCYSYDTKLVLLEEI